MNSTNTVKLIPINKRISNIECNNLKLEISYRKGVGYNLYITPVRIDSISTKYAIMESGVFSLIICNRKSLKQMENAIKVHNDSLYSLLEYIKSKYDIELKENDLRMEMI